VGGSRLLSELDMGMIEITPGGVHHISTIMLGSAGFSSASLALSSEPAAATVSTAAHHRSWSWISAYVFPGMSSAKCDSTASEPPPRVDVAAAWCARTRLA
jgi:hypothetical protein